MLTQVVMTLERNDWAHSGQATFTWSLPPELMYFQGHFPQHQILPAVAQLKLLMDALHQLEPQLQFKGAPAIKFTSILQPHDQVRLELNFNRATMKLRFTYYRVTAGTDAQITSSGTIALEAAPDVTAKSAPTAQPATTAKSATTAEPAVSAEPVVTAEPSCEVAP